MKPSLGFREGTQYNNFMYVVLSYLPTVLLPNKPPFGRYVKEHILDPLGMNSSTYSFAVANDTGRMADGFARENINTTENPLGPGTTRVLPFFFPNSTEDGDSEPFFVWTSVMELICGLCLLQQLLGMAGSSARLQTWCAVTMELNCNCHSYMCRRAGCRCFSWKANTPQLTLP